MSRPPCHRQERKKSSPGSSGGLGLCSATDVVSSRPMAKSTGPKPVTWLNPLLLGIFSGPNRTKLSFELHKLKNLAKPGVTRRISRRKQDLSIWLKAISESMAPFFVVVAVLIV